MHGHDDAGRLVREIFGLDGTHARCTFDAEVAVEAGRITTIEAIGTAARVELGSDIKALPDDLRSGQVIPMPVHVVDGQAVAGYAECEVLTPGLAEGTAASNADASPKSWADLYPSGSGHLSYRAWTVNAQPVPTQDSLLIISDVESYWEAPFDYALAAGGDRQFDFQGVSYNDSSAEASYARMDNTDQVLFFCQNGINTACFSPTQRNAQGQVLKANVIYGPAVWQDPNPSFQHGLAHEFGHGFALAHHIPQCTTVMSPDGCTQLASAADIATALGTVLGY